MKLVFSSLLLASFIVGCGDVATIADAGHDAGADVASDAPRLFCSPAVGPVDASAPNPPAIYECKPGEECWVGPNFAYICCRPDSGIACSPK